MAKMIPELLKDINKLPTREERLDALKENDSNLLRIMLKWNFDKSLNCLLPEGKPPYKPAEKAKFNLYTAADRKMFQMFFVKKQNMNQLQREMNFVRLLESISPAEAELLCKIKDGSLNYIGITKKLCREAFPDLIAE